MSLCGQELKFVWALCGHKTRWSGTPPRYCHLLLQQQDEVDPAFWEELYAYIDHAHEGARQALRAPLEDSLHPLHHGTEDDPAFGYPQKFGDTTLKGFFGEIVAGIVAAYCTDDDEHKWEVPVYLFRTHIVGFQQLERMKQTNDWQRHIMGRTGDDGLAFARDENGRIFAWLACEAKCTGAHSATLIADNHEKLSQAVNRPIDLLRLIDALNDYRDDEYGSTWVEALRKYWWQLTENHSTDRCDLSTYICGSPPIRNETWITPDMPHEKYTGKRDLTSVEFHLPDVEERIRSLYSQMEDSE
jgi:hypothetical protein